MATSEISETSSFYVENSNGRFRRVIGASKDSDTRTWRLPVHHNATNERDRKSWLDVKTLAFVGFLFLQGILSGLSLSSLYQAFTVQLPGELLANSAAANETRRYFFIAITFCVTGSLCVLEEDATKLLDSSGKTPNATMCNVCLVVIYFLALVATLLCSHADVHIVYTAMQISEGDIRVSSDDLLSILHKWRSFAVPRSVLCILGWFVSCCKFIATRKNADRVE